MLTNFAKQVAARLPHASQQALKRRRFAREIIAGTFQTDEPEWAMASQWLSEGDWAIDVGANIGHYSKRFSDLVGSRGRVISFEPVPATFELLAANAARFQYANVTLLNLAASNATEAVSIAMPRFATGLVNYYEAAVTKADTGLGVLACSIDALSLPHRVRVLKIDAEGHDAVVLRGAQTLLARDRPVVVIETAAAEVMELLGALGYTSERLDGSSNVIFRAGQS